jgi:hypothetical protein
LMPMCFRVPVHVCGCMTVCVYGARLCDCVWVCCTPIRCVFCDLPPFLCL